MTIAVDLGRRATKQTNKHVATQLLYVMCFFTYFFSDLTIAHALPNGTGVITMVHDMMGTRTVFTGHHNKLDHQRKSV